MLVPIILFLILSGLIRRAANKHKVSNTVPLLISGVIYLIFVISTRGIIRVKPNEFGQAIILGLLMYAAVGAILYWIAYAWIKNKSSSKQESTEEDTEN